MILKRLPLGSWEDPPVASEVYNLLETLHRFPEPGKRDWLTLDVLITFSFPCCDQIPGKKHLGEKALVSGSQLEKVQSIVMDKAGPQNHPSHLSRSGEGAGERLIS